MTRQRVIALDVDLVLTDIIDKWHMYLRNICLSYDARRYKKDLQHERVDYNITRYYELPMDVDGFDFWRQHDLYDNAKLLKYAKEVIMNWYMDGHELVFVSYCFQNHMDSKIKFLKRSLSFIDESDFHFISTKSKGMVRADVIIDDRHLFLNQMSPKTLCIKFHTPYTQCEEARQHYITYNNWKDLGEMFKGK
jgi:5'(3')-deoxyribonucleotidase